MPSLRALIAVSVWRPRASSGSKESLSSLGHAIGKKAKLQQRSFATALYEGREEEVASTYPLKRLGVPEDVGSVVAFLLSDDASWVTGHILVIDGGVTLTGGV